MLPLACIGTMLQCPACPAMDGTGEDGSCRHCRSSTPWQPWGTPGTGLTRLACTRVDAGMGSNPPQQTAVRVHGGLKLIPPTASRSRVGLDLDLVMCCPTVCRDDLRPTTWRKRGGGDWAFLPLRAGSHLPAMSSCTSTPASPLMDPSVMTRSAAILSSAHPSSSGTSSSQPGPRGSYASAAGSKAEAAPPWESASQ